MRSNAARNTSWIASSPQESLQAGYVPSFEMDVWALGVTIFLWVFGTLPFNGAVPFLIYECIRRQVGSHTHCWQPRFLPESADRPVPLLTSPQSFVGAGAALP